MVLEAVQNTSSVNLAEKVNNSVSATSTINNETIKMVQKQNPEIKPFHSFSNPKHLTGEAYDKALKDYQQSRVNYYVKQFESHGALQKIQPEKGKVFGFKYSIGRDGYKIDTKAMQKALGENHELTLEQVRSYLGLTKEYVKSRVGDLQGKEMQYCSGNLLKDVDADAINACNK